MAKAATDDRADAKRESKSRPYAPSWVNRLTALVDRLPGPAWLGYLGIGLALFLLQAGVLWGEGVRPTTHLLSVQGALTGIAVLFFAFLHYLDSIADTALQTLRPAMTTSAEEYGELHFRLTTLPALPALLACLAVITAAVLMNIFIAPPDSLDEVTSSPISAAVIYAAYLLTWWVTGALVYHTIHQLWTINHIYTAHTRINVYRTSPLYALSRVTALTAVSLTIPTYAWFAINPGLLYEPIAIVILLSITALALGVFIWPLLGVHRLLVKEKTHLLDETALRFEATIVDLHRRVDCGDLEGMDDLNKAIASLVMERNELNKIPTWPWQPETVRLLVTALALPLGLWIIQFVLQRILAP